MRIRSQQAGSATQLGTRRRRTLSALAAGLVLAATFLAGPQAHAQAARQSSFQPAFLSSSIALDVDRNGYAESSFTVPGTQQQDDSQQQDYGQQQGGNQGQSNPLVGTWHGTMPGGSGGIVHSFWQYMPDGHYIRTMITVGGPRGVNGMRMQFWGQYRLQPQGNGTYLMEYTSDGRLPLQLCAVGVGCRAAVNGPLPSPAQAIYRFHGNMLQGNDGTTAERSQAPAGVFAQLPDTYTIPALPQPPQVSGGGSTGGSSGGRYVSPKNNIPGLGGNCDDLQVSRVCTINDGSTYRDHNTGCLVCTK